MGKRGIAFGIGVGIIMSSFIILISYSFEYKEVNASEIKVLELSDEDIIDRAKKLGMVFVSDIPETSTQTENTEMEDTEMNNILPDDTVLEDDITIPHEEDTIIINFEKGSSSQSFSKLLEENGVINNQYEFNNFLQERDVTKKLRAGEIIFKRNMSFEEILDLIT